MSTIFRSRGPGVAAAWRYYFYSTSRLSTTPTLERSTPAYLEATTCDGLDLDAKAIDRTIQTLRQSFWRFGGNSSVTGTSPASVMPQIRSCSDHFDFLFSAILYKFLDGATRQVQDGGRAMDESLASICAAIASSLVDRCALVQVALESIPFHIKEAFGSSPWSWQAVRYVEETTHRNYDSATGVYAYHLTKINNGGEQNFYVGQTTKSFASRWAAHARHRKATKRPKKYSATFYGNLKLTKPKNINIFVLADISVFQEDVLAHKAMAMILEAGFCVFFNSVRSSKLPENDESESFALSCRPTDMPAVPWLGMNFAFPLSQDFLLRPWLREEVDILKRLQEREKNPVLAQGALAKAGFKRSLLAISAKRRTLDLQNRRRA